MCAGSVWAQFVMRGGVARWGPISLTLAAVVLFACVCFHSGPQLPPVPFYCSFALPVQCETEKPPTHPDWLLGACVTASQAGTIRVAEWWSGVGFLAACMTVAFAVMIQVACLEALCDSHRCRRRLHLSPRAKKGKQQYATRIYMRVEHLNCD